MPPHPIWRGHLRLALVTCPVALFAANHDRGSLHFNLINPETGNRIRMITLDAETEEEVSRGDLVKGYEYEKDNYLILSDEDFESARVESSGTIKIDKFVDLADIDPIYFDASYYLVPDGDAGSDVFVVLRDAVAAAGKAALARVVIARRERAIAILPMDQGMVAHTLHEARELNDADTIFKDVPRTRPDAEMIRLAKELIARQSGAYDPGDFEDRYESRLRELIAAKLKGKGLKPAAVDEPDRGNVVDLMSALRRSLGQSEDKPLADKPPARAKRAAVATKSRAAKKPAAKAVARGR